MVEDHLCVQFAVPEHAAFVMVEDHNKSGVFRDGKLDVDSSLQDDKSGVFRDSQLGVDGFLRNDKTGTYRDFKKLTHKHRNFLRHS